MDAAERHLWPTRPLSAFWPPSLLELCWLPALPALLLWWCLSPPPLTQGLHTSCLLPEADQLNDQLHNMKTRHEQVFILLYLVSWRRSLLDGESNLGCSRSRTPVLGDNNRTWVTLCAVWWWSDVLPFCSLLLFNHAEAQTRWPVKKKEKQTRTLKTAFLQTKGKHNNHAIKIRSVHD